MRKNTFMWRIIIIVFCLMMAAPAWADSLWSDQSQSLYTNKPRTFKTGDLITILIVEQASASQEASSSNDKKGSIGAGPGKGPLNFIPEIGVDWNSKSAGDGSTTRGGTLKAKITVEVKEVKPNGVLAVEGLQEIKVNKENQTIKISGRARPEDVSSDNLILSTCIANAKIEFQGNGTVGETQNVGLLTKIFHWLF